MFSILPLTLFNVSIKYGYLGKKFIHRLYTAGTPFIDKPFPHIYSDLCSCICQELTCWCTGVSCIRAASLTVSYEGEFAK